MMSPRGVLVQSLVSSVSPERESMRRAELNEFSNPVKRLAALTLHQIAITHPTLVINSLGLEMNHANAEYIGSGDDAIVYKVSGNAVKVHTRSIGLTETALSDYAATKQLKFEKMKHALSTFVLDQETTVGIHPVYQNTAAITIQPYQESIVGAELFNTDSRVWRLFVSRAKEFYQRENLVPDLWGKNNLIVNPHSVEQVLLLDGHPIEPDSPGGLATLRRLKNLETALQ